MKSDLLSGKARSPKVALGEVRSLLTPRNIVGAIGILINVIVLVLLIVHGSPR